MNENGVVSSNGNLDEFVKQKRREYARKYYQKNKERLNEQARKWRAEHKEEFNEKRYRKGNREKQYRRYSEYEKFLILQREFTDEELSELLEHSVHAIELARYRMQVGRVSVPDFAKHLV